jgi:SAM-dependent methyltransferase
VHRDTIVDEFTHQAETFGVSAVARVPDALVALAAPRERETWLDAACGPGTIARALAPHVAAVHGVDATPAMVEVARRDAPANITFALGDVTRLENADATFDGAVTRFSIHHVPLPGRMVAELARVVRPGGTVVLVDHVADEDADTLAWSQEVERLRDPSHWASLPPARLRALGRGAGLTLEQEQLEPLAVDLEDWLTRGSGPRDLVEAALAHRPRGSECFRVEGGALHLRLWLSRWRRP